MADLPHVVICGRDPLLLETRRWILARGPYRVSTVLKVDGDEDGEWLEGIDLLILCHTLNAADQRVAMEQVRRTSGDVRLLILARDYASHTVSPTAHSLGVFAGPEAFVNSVRQLLMEDFCIATAAVN